MKSKFIKFLISTLLIILTITSIFTYKTYQNKQHTIQANINNQAKIEQQDFKVIDKQSVVNSIKLENSLNVLSGQATFQETFTNANISDQDINMNFLKKWLNENTSKDITPTATYQFTFSFDLRDFSIDNVKIKDNKIHIRLDPNKLSLNSFETIKVDSTDRVGLFKTKFSPSQINTINSRLKDEARNTILSNETYRTKALENLQGDLKDNIKAFVGNNIQVLFDIPNYDTVEQSVATIVNK
jgi:hypothetical protein